MCQLDKSNKLALALCMILLLTGFTACAGLSENPDKVAQISNTIRVTTKGFVRETLLFINEEAPEYLAPVMDEMQTTRDQVFLMVSDPENPPVVANVVTVVTGMFNRINIQFEVVSGSWAGAVLRLTNDAADGILGYFQEYNMLPAEAMAFGGAFVTGIDQGMLEYEMYKPQTN